MKVELIEGWQKSYRFLSVQLAVILAAADMAYEYLPTIQAYLPEGWVRFAALAIVLARIIRQAKAHDQG